MKRVFNLIIVDESGSMSVIRKQAFSGMNETLSSVRAMQQAHPETDQRVTLVTFDSNHTTWHFDDAPVQDTRDLRWDAYNPSGCTPLYDAMGRAIAKVEAQACPGDNVLVTVITDGEENSSREWTLSLIRRTIERLKQQHWTFALIGTDNLDVDSMARGMCIDEHLTFCQDNQGTTEMFAKMSRARSRYNACLCAEAAMPVGSLFDEG
ncbi:MAG: VWA domain-containing protein [Bacteroidaceae bacterium]|nr:VWA domain-containing protein [Bacteroidaceae bacterium]